MAILTSIKFLKHIFIKYVISKFFTVSKSKWGIKFKFGFWTVRYCFFLTTTVDKVSTVLLVRYIGTIRYDTVQVHHSYNRYIPVLVPFTVFWAIIIVENVERDKLSQNFNIKGLLLVQYKRLAFGQKVLAFDHPLF